MKTTTEQPSCKRDLQKLFTLICPMLISTGQFRLFKGNVRIFVTMLVFMGGLMSVSYNSEAQCTSFGVDFKQAANRDGGYAPGELHWINSILQNSNSRYIEGMSTLQRVVFTNLASCGGNHSLRIKLEAKKGSSHAYDFITSWDNAYRATQAIAPGMNLIPARGNPYLHECDAAISQCAEDACNAITGGGVGNPPPGTLYRDLPVIFGNYADPTGAGEKNLAIPGPPADQNTTRQVIQTYECRYGDNKAIAAGTFYGGVGGTTYDRTVRVYTGNGFSGDNGDENNAVLFVGYGGALPNDGDSTYIYYDIKWSSTSPSVVIEFAAHIAVGVDNLAADNPGNCNVTDLGVGYLLNHGASAISGGPYHVILEDFQDAPGNTPKCEGNLGNQDNQLQGAEILLIPECDLTGPSAVCSNATATYTAQVFNPDNEEKAGNSTYKWEIIGSSQAPPPASIIGSATGIVPKVPVGQTSVPLSITVNTGGVGTYTVKLTITNGTATMAIDDDLSSTCSVSTTVSGGPTITCPQNTTVAACSSTSAISTAFTNWLNSVQVTGSSTRNPANPVAPGVCGGTTSVTWTVTNDCGTQTCSSSFTVASAPAVVLTCAQNTTLAACTSQADVNTAYANWLASATATGGCNRGNVTNSGGAAPDACAGGTRTVTFTVTSTCETKTCSASFTVNAAPAVVLTCVQNTTIAACTSQANVNAAYAAWLASATATGGCNRGNVTNSGGAAPDACAGGTRTVTFTVTSTCETKTCSASFTVNPAPAVVLTCAQNTTVNSCLTQDQVNSLYANWLTKATASGGCGLGSVTNNGGSAPNKCGGTKTVTFTVTSNCEAPKTCSATFTVTADNTAPVFVTTPASIDIDCMAAIPASVTPTATDNCGTPSVALTGTTDVPADCTTGFKRIITRTWTATDACGNTAAYTQTIRVKCCETVCTLTQGAYGNKGGNICLPNGTTVNQTQIMIDALTAAPGNKKVFGRQDLGKYWVINLSDVNTGGNANIFKMLPGGGQSQVFGTDVYAGDPQYSNTASWPVVPLQANGPKKGSIRNQLFAQTLTLWFNTTITGSTLANVKLDGSLAMIASRNCGSSEPVGTITPIQLVSTNISTYLATHGYPTTVAGLLQLANDALGGVNVSPLTLDEIQGAVGGINETFDECRILTGYTAPAATENVLTSAKPTTAEPTLEVSTLEVTAYPNPYRENFSLQINSPVSGQALISFYTIDGIKIGEMKRDVVAKKSLTVPYNVPAFYRTRVVYTVTVGSHNAKGIVLRPNEP